MKRAVVIGAGMGGLTAAIRLARADVAVEVVEASSSAGGLASSVAHEGLTFDAGPYILLDLPGLTWAFRALDLALEDHLVLRKIEDVYEVSAGDGPPVRFFADRDATAERMERDFPGSAKKYLAYVEHVTHVNDKLRPTLYVSHPGVTDLIRNGALLQARFLLRSLHSVLSSTGLPPPIVDAIAIWTHVAGQTLDVAPSPLSFVPALIHGVGAFYPRGGIGSIPRALEAVARSLGVSFRFDTKVRAIRVDASRRARAIETEDGDVLEGDAIVCNGSAIAAYLQALDGTPKKMKRDLAALPLQSPGVCAYLSIAARERSNDEPSSPYLRFRLEDDGELTRALIQPQRVDDGCVVNGRAPARILGPMKYDQAREGGVAGQEAYLDHLIGESWWRAHVDDPRVVARRTPTTWASAHHLYAESMNPVMTAKFMRQGRIAHRSPCFQNLYFCGSSTHPGQWVSFAAVSGVLAADRVREDLGC